MSGLKELQATITKEFGEHWRALKRGAPDVNLGDFGVLKDGGFDQKGTLKGYLENSQLDRRLLDRVLDQLKTRRGQQHNFLDASNKKQGTLCRVKEIAGWELSDFEGSIQFHEGLRAETLVEESLFGEALILLIREHHLPWNPDHGIVVKKLQSDSSIMFSSDSKNRSLNVRISDNVDFEAVMTASGMVGHTRDNGACLAVTMLFPAKSVQALADYDAQITEESCRCVIMDEKTTTHDEGSETSLQDKRIKLVYDLADRLEPSS